MARNSRTLEEFLALVAAKVGYGDFSDSAVDTNPKLKRIKIFYKARYEDLLTAYPWGFASKRVALDRFDNEDGSIGASFKFLLPRDGLYLWEVSDSPSRSGYTNSGWDGISVHSYLSFPISSISQAFVSDFQSTIEVIGDYIYSNSTSLFCLYTHFNDIPFGNIDVQFLNVLENLIEETILRSDKADMEKLSYVETDNRRRNREILAANSNEFDRGRKVRMSDTMAKIQAMF